MHSISRIKSYLPVFSGLLFLEVMFSAREDRKFYQSFCTKTRKCRILQQGAGEADFTHMERQDQPNRFSEFSFCSKRPIISVWYRLL